MRENNVYISGRLWIDWIFILAVPFITVALVILFPSFFSSDSYTEWFSWLIIVLVFDVAHVVLLMGCVVLDVVDAPLFSVVSC